MKKVIFILFLVLSISLQAQGNLFGSLRLGVNIKQDLYGFGGTALISKEIKPSLYISFSAGYYYWGESSTPDVNPITSEIETESPNSLFPFSLGIKYYFSNSNFIPYLAAEWGMNYYKVNVFNREYELMNGHYIRRRINLDNSLFASAGIGLGTLINIGERLFADIGFVTHYSKEGQFINLSGGLAYQL